MWFLFSFMLLMGALDSLNPSTIIIHILLLGILKNQNRIAIYIAGIWIVYFVGGIAIFTGFTAVFNYLAAQFALIPDFLLHGLEGLLGIILVVYGILKWRKHGGHKQVTRSLDVSTWALIVLGAGGTLGDMPTAIPYLGFMTKMTEMTVDLSLGIVLITGYCFIYTFPLFMIWGLYRKFQEQIKGKMESIVQRIESANRYIMIVLSEIAGVFFMLDSANFFVGISVQ